MIRLSLKGVYDAIVLAKQSIIPLRMEAIKRCAESNLELKEATVENMRANADKTHAEADLLRAQTREINQKIDADIVRQMAEMLSTYVNNVAPKPLTLEQQQSYIREMMPTVLKILNGNLEISKEDGYLFMMLNKKK